MWRLPLIVAATLSIGSFAGCENKVSPPAAQAPSVADVPKSTSTASVPTVEPIVERVTKSEPAAGSQTFDTPQACVDALASATKANDFKSFLNCFSETAQNQQIGQIAYGLQMKAFYEPESADKVIALFEEHDLIDVDVQGEMQVYSMRPEGVGMALNVVGDRVRNKERFLIGALKISGAESLRKDGLGDVVDLVIEGEVAKGTYKTPDGDAPVIFRKINNSWVLGAQEELGPATDREARKALLQRIASQPAEQIKVIKAIRRFGGVVEFEESGPPYPVIKVHLSGPSITDDFLAQIGALSELRSLGFSSTKVHGSGLAHLAGLKNLQEIDLDGTDIDDANLVHLSKLTQLKSINLDGMGITDAGLAHLKELRNLQSLALSGKVSGEGLAELAELPNLTELNLSGHELTDDGLASLRQLPHLVSLTIVSGVITDAGLEHLKKLNDLKRLTIQCRSVTDSGLVQLQTALPQCVIDRDGRNSRVH